MNRKIIKSALVVLDTLLKIIIICLQGTKNGLEGNDFQSVSLYLYYKLFSDFVNPDCLQGTDYRFDVVIRNF